jgi:vitamin B12 transporter
MRSSEGEEDNMNITKLWRAIFSGLFFLCFLVPSQPANAAPRGIVRGHVVDPLGGSIANAGITLLENNKEVGKAKTGRDGGFEFSDLAAGRYSIHVEAAGFESQNSPPAYVSDGGASDLDVILYIGPIRQEVVVSATGTEVPESQVGASVSVLDRNQLEKTNVLDVLDALQTIPGMQVVETGQRGGTTSVFVRGGDADFNKVLIDGIPANDVGGAAEFANLATTGVSEVEILRGPNSVLYGSDGLGSVINITTRRGTTTLPELSYSVDGGNFGTLREDGTLAGAYRQFDYFSEFSRFDTRNSIPNNAFHNGTYAGNFGWTPNGKSDIRLTVRHTAAALGDPNAFAFYGIPDEASQADHDTYVGVTAQNQTTPRWHNLVRFASTQLQFSYIDHSPAGTPFDPFVGTPYDTGPNYLGNTVTICGANGFCTAGQAVLDYAGVYPQTYNSSTTRRSLYGQSDYQFRPDVGVTAGFRYEHEDGFTNSQGIVSPTVRNNYSTFLEGHGSLRHRLYATAGVGFDKNAVFGFAATPRVSIAYYLRRPSTSGFLNDTKLKFNFATGIKEPSIAEQGSSLYQLLSQLPQGSALIATYGISPIGPERSRSFDFGVEQDVWHNRARVGITFFHNDFYNLIEFVDAGVLPEFGVPPDVANATAFGAYINSDSFRALGAGIDPEVDLGHGLRVRGSYTYLDAVVTRSFTGSALQPAINPAFPNIPIGAFAPLVGARPFDRAPHSGSLLLSYTQKKFDVALNGYFVGRRDGSTFLTDGYLGNSMLLPNRNLQAAYQVIDLSGNYPINSHVTAYLSISNLLSKHYQAEIGYPSLPLTFRAGMKFTLGGESGWWK